MIPDDLEKRQRDPVTGLSKYAVFLPAISGALATFIGKQRFEEYVKLSRIPASMNKNLESINFLAPKDCTFRYPWALYSAGHASMDLGVVPKEDMTRNRDPNTFLLGDSGGFQIAKGLWPGNWADKNCPKAANYRKRVLDWMEAFNDYSMILDIPTWTYKDPKAAEATSIYSYHDAVKATHINNEYFMANRQGRTKFLNVLQGGTHQEADEWYDMMKGYCDPKLYPGTHFNGWAMGGQNMCDVHLILKRIITLMYDGLLEEGKQDWMHFLGTSKLEWAVLLTDIQNAVRKYHNPKFTISFDCASPFLATANGWIYSYNRIKDRGKWSYKILSAADDKKYATDTRMYGDVMRDDFGFDFNDSPVTSRLQVRDICHYKPGDLNKIGKEGKTSWDSYSYALQMAHNVWSHCNAVLTANEEYVKGITPAMLVEEKFEPIFFKDIVEEIFSVQDRDKSLEIIDKYSRFWMRFVGTRGSVGKKTMNSITNFHALFEEIQPQEEDQITEQEMNHDSLDQLEQSVEKQGSVDD